MADEGRGLKAIEGNNDVQKLQSSLRIVNWGLKDVYDTMVHSSRPAKIYTTLALSHRYRALLWALLIKLRGVLCDWLKIILACCQPRCLIWRWVERYLLYIFTARSNSYHYSLESCQPQACEEPQLRLRGFAIHSLF